MINKEIDQTMQLPQLQVPQPVKTLEVAGALVAKGAYVFPLRRWGKLPFEGSFYNAASDLALIASAFEQGQNVGIATGRECGGGIVVLDFDVPVKGQAMEFREMDAVLMLVAVLAQVMGQDAAIALLNAAPRVRTPSGGWQVYLRQEGDAVLTSRSGISVNGICEKGFGLPTNDGTCFDTRGKGGYAVAVGSVTSLIMEDIEGGGQAVKQSAGTYQLYLNGEPADLRDLPDMIEWPELPNAAVGVIEALPIVYKERSGTADNARLGVENPPAGTQATSSVLANAPAYATQSPSKGSSMNFNHRAPKDPQRVRDALSRSVAHAPARYASRNGWFDTMSALAGAAAAGELSEEEADAIYDWFCANTSGNKSDNADQWQKTKGLARDRLRNGEEVRGCKSILDQALADGWVAPTPEPAANNAASQSASDEWPGGAKRDKNGTTPLHNAPNAGAMLERMGFKFRFITRGYFHEVLPPDKYVSAAMPAGWQALGNAQARQLTDLLIKSGLRSIKLDIVTQAFKTLGDLVPFDPFKTELECLPKWDGMDRIEDFPSRYLGAKREDITAAWTKHFFMQLMARTYAAGCKADEVLILLGPQRTGKSTALRAIVGGQYFTDALTFSDSAQEVVEKTHRTALAEIAELQGLSGRGADKNKAMISRQEDRARLAYDRATSQVPRSFVLAGTGNDETPFNDPTGALRFMPITVGVVNVAGIERDRDQLLAEALHKFRAEFGGDARRVRLASQWWSKGKAETEKYQNIDPWEDTISALLVDEHGRLRVWTDSNGVHGHFVSSNELLGRLLPSGYNKNGSHTQRLSKLMNRLGFDKMRPQLDGKRQSGYFRPFTHEEIAWRSVQVRAGQPIDQGQGISLAAGLSVI